MNTPKKKRSVSVCRMRRKASYHNIKMPILKEIMINEEKKIYTLPTIHVDIKEYKK